MTNNSVEEPEDLQRLQKYMARCGVASRRASEKLIAQGHVCVNGKTVTKLGTKICSETDVVTVEGAEIFPLKNSITIVLNKPAGYVSTMNDPQGRPCVASLIPHDEYPSLFPVGRLDRLTRGLLVFTTDGTLGQRLLHPSHEIGKTYEVVVQGKISQNGEEVQRLEAGVEILPGKTSPAQVKVLEYFGFEKYQLLENDFFKNCAIPSDRESLPSTNTLLNSNFTKVQITIHEGKNRQVRRMFSAVGHEVLLLTRIKIGNLQINNLEPGNWAKLTPEQINDMEH